VLISGACHELLQQLKVAEHLVTYSSYMAGTQIYQAIYLRESGKDDLRVNLRREEWKKAGPIMTVRNPENQDLLFSIVDGGHLSLKIRQDSSK